MENILIVEEKDFSKIKEKIEKNKDKKIILPFSNEELARKALDKLKIDVLLVNLSKNKDKLKERGSSFNQVLSRLCKKANVKLGINLNEIINSETKEKAEIIARINQNVKISKKAELEIAFILKKENKRSLYDLKSLALVLGVNTKTTKNLEIIYFE